MSTIAIAPRQVAASRVAAASTGVASALSDTADVAWRNLLTQLRTPQALVFATIQPVIFVLLFRYAFGGAIHVPGTNYVDFLMPGIFAQTVAFGAVGTAVGLSGDLRTGTSRSRGPEEPFRTERERLCAQGAVPTPVACVPCQGSEFHKASMGRAGGRSRANAASAKASGERSSSPWENGHSSMISIRPGGHDGQMAAQHADVWPHILWTSGRKVHGHLAARCQGMT